MFHRCPRLLAALLVLLFVPTLRAVSPPATGPKVLEAPPRMVIYPFTPLGDAGAYAWVGQGVQQSLLVEVGRPGTAVFVLTTSPSTNAEPDPVAAAARAGAALAVFGSYQIVEQTIRLTGQVIDTSNRQTIATLSATGLLKDLFKLQDAMGEQLRSALPHSAISPPAYGLAAEPPVLDQFQPLYSRSGHFYASPTDTYMAPVRYVPSYTYSPAYCPPVNYYPYYPRVSSFVRFGGARDLCDRRYDGFIHFENSFSDCRRDGFVSFGSFRGGGSFVGGGSFGAGVGGGFRSHSGAFNYPIAIGRSGGFPIRSAGFSAAVGVGRPGFNTVGFGTTGGSAFGRGPAFGAGGGIRVGGGGGFSGPVGRR